MSISVGKEKIDTHRSQIVVLCLQSGGFRTKLMLKVKAKAAWQARTKESHLKV